MNPFEKNGEDETDAQRVHKSFGDIVNAAIANGLVTPDSLNPSSQQPDYDFALEALLCVDHLKSVADAIVDAVHLESRAASTETTTTALPLTMFDRLRIHGKNTSIRDVRESMPDVISLICASKHSDDKKASWLEFARSMIISPELPSDLRFELENQLNDPEMSVAVSELAEQERYHKLATKLQLEDEVAEILRQKFGDHDTAISFAQAIVLWATIRRTELQAGFTQPKELLDAMIPELPMAEIAYGTAVVEELVLAVLESMISLEQQNSTED